MPAYHTRITSKILRVLRIILVVLPEHPSDTKVLTMKMEILLELTSNKLLEILLKMNLPDHKLVLIDPEVHVKMEMEIPRSSGVNSQPLLCLTLNVTNHNTITETN
ncbi:hypothetical protein Tco_0290285 [Tanacetum coccineum]